MARCASCGETGGELKRCTACKAAHYCNVVCQRNHRKVHREECKRLETAMLRRGKHTLPAVGASVPDNPHVFFTGPSGVKVASEDDFYWSTYRQDATSATSIAAVRVLPQDVMEAWQLKVVRYWTRPDRSDAQWYLEVLNATPLVRNETKGPLLLYREPWIPPLTDEGRPGSDDLRHFGDKLASVLMSAMAEGGRVMAQHTVMAANLAALPKEYFVPRRPGAIALDKELQPYLDQIKLRLEGDLNIIIIILEESTGIADGKLLELFETRGNTVLERDCGVEIRCLTKKERKEQLDHNTFSKEMAEDASYLDGCLYPPLTELTDCEPRWQREGYDNLEEAQEDLEDEYTKDELEEEIAGWQEQGYETLEAALLDCYNARDLEEVAWDAVGIPRLIIAGEDWKESEQKLKRAGWRYQGYKPGKDFEIDEGTVKYGQRVVQVGGGMWLEPPRGR